MNLMVILTMLVHLNHIEYEKNISQINPTMTSGGRLVLIWVQMCRTLLGDKDKPLSGDNGICTDEHGPKI